MTHSWPFFSLNFKSELSPGWFQIGCLVKIISQSCNSRQALGLVHVCIKNGFRVLWNEVVLLTNLGFLLPLPIRKAFQPEIFKEHLTDKFSSYPFSIIQFPSYFRKESFLFADWSINRPWTIAAIRGERWGWRGQNSLCGGGCGTQGRREKV